MLRRILILDVLLIAGLITGVIRIRQGWLSFVQSHQAAAIQPKPESFPPIASAAAPASAALSDWTDIPARNVFSFDRSDIALVARAEPVKPPGAKPMLFGTLSLGNERMAMLGPGQPGNRSYRAMKVGEVLDGWTVVDIQEKSVVISANEIKETVIMNDPSVLAPRDHTRTLATMAPAQPVVVATPPPALPAPSNNSATASPGSARKQTVIQTPFGPKVVTEP